MAWSESKAWMKGTASGKLYQGLLDDASTAQMLDLLLQAASDEGATLVVATHDARVVQKLAGRVVERVLA